MRQLQYIFFFLGIADEFFKFFEFSSAAYDGDLEAIKRFLSEGLLHQVPEYRGWTVIHTCVFANQAEALRAILDYNPKNRKFLANLCIWEGSSLLYLSILRDGTSIDVIRTLLESGANPNKCTNEGFSPLHLACYKKRSVEVVKLLVNHGADVNATEAKIKYTPLHFAIDVGADIDLLEYLVDICDVNVEDSVHKTPLFKACASDFMEAVKLILKKDTRSVNVSPISEFSALSSAASVGNLEMVRLLLEAGADTEFKGRAKVDQQMFQQNNFLPIHSAFSNIEVFKLLLKNTGSATIEKHDSLLYPLTFLIYTVVYGPSTEFLEALLEHEFPPELGHLKTPTVQHLISFFLATSHELPPEVLHAKFHLFFKYFLHLTPVSFVERQILSEELVDNYNILHLLTRMGLCADFGLSSRQLLLRSLNLMEADSVRDSVISETISLLNQPVLSLMQLSRLKCRQHLREKVQDDWTAYKMVRDSCLPNALKQYLWFQVLD